MPITLALELEQISDEEFAAIDAAVMRCAYSVQNQLGRLFDERVYENALATQLRIEGLAVHTQVPVLITHADFQKTFYLDLVVNQMLYELKVASSLTGEHEAQCLHYAMLQGIRLVKLINFGEQKVRGKLLRNSLRSADRYQPRFDLSGMRIITPKCELLLTYLKAIINDWGTHLSNCLYNDALIYFFGEEQCTKRIELNLGAILLGTHRVQYHSDGLAFVVTSLSRRQAAYEEHLRVLLAHSRLKAIQWINLNHSLVEIITVDSAYYHLSVQRGRLSIHSLSRQ